MDKLRALEYLVCAAREGSLSAAARRLDVSVPAISKLLAALERTLGTTLFERNAAGLRLTASGQEYLDACAPALEQIAQAEAAVGRARTQAVGPVSIAAQPLLHVHCLAPVLHRFHARHPKIQLDLRDLVREGDPDAEAADLRLAAVWGKRDDEVERVLCRTRLVVCASPHYWARHGLPERPRDLAQHTCFAIRAPRGTLMDHWPFERDGEPEAVQVRGWLATGNVGRDAAVAAALAGEGVIRTLDITLEEPLRSGRLVAALADWVATDSPVVRLTYRPAAIRLPRVRLVADELRALFQETELRCTALAGPRHAGSPPPWAGPRFYRRASGAVRGD
jgi:DNA-binding transcriptional LysR family regulator